MGAWDDALESGDGLIQVSSFFVYYEDLEKRGGCCDGARETREPRVTIARLLQKRTFYQIFPLFMILMLDLA